MKYLYSVLAILILASCSSSETPTEVTNTEIDSAIESTTNDIENEISNIEENIETSTWTNEWELTDSNKMVKVEAKYNNPQQEVDMSVAYSLDSEGKIETINVSATNWDLAEYNTAAQAVIWKTLEEASEFSVAGASETNAAFQNAIK